MLRDEALTEEGLHVRHLLHEIRDVAHCVVQALQAKALEAWGRFLRLVSCNAWALDSVEPQAGDISGAERKMHKV